MLLAHAEEVADHAADHGAAVAAEKIGETRVGAKNAAVLVMDEDGIADRIESVDPLLLDGFDLVKEIHIFNGVGEEVGDVDQISELVFMKPFALQCADTEKTDGAFFATEGDGDELGDAGFSHF